VNYCVEGAPPWHRFCNALLRPGAQPACRPFVPRRQCRTPFRRLPQGPILRQTRRADACVVVLAELHRRDMALTTFSRRLYPALRSVGVAGMPQRGPGHSRPRTHVPCGDDTADHRVPSPLSCACRVPSACHCCSRAAVRTGPHVRAGAGYVPLSLLACPRPPGRARDNCAGVGCCVASAWPCIITTVMNPPRPRSREPGADAGERQEWRRYEHGRAGGAAFGGVARRLACSETISADHHAPNPGVRCSPRPQSLS
jgi:hypothetical protein